MDIQMPYIDGLEATEAIRARGIGPDQLPIVALTANAYADDVAACLAAGMQAHIAKPIAKEALEKALRRWCHSDGLPTKLERRKRERSSEENGKDLLQRYALRKTEALESVAALIRQGEFTDRDVAAVKHLLHKLAGTAAMFGEAELGSLAAACEHELSGWPLGNSKDNILASATALIRAA